MKTPWQPFFLRTMEKFNIVFDKSFFFVKSYHVILQLYLKEATLFCSRNQHTQEYNRKIKLFKLFLSLLAP